MLSLLIPQLYYTLKFPNCILIFIYMYQCICITRHKENQQCKTLLGRDLLARIHWPILRKIGSLIVNFQGIPRKLLGYRTLILVGMHDVVVLGEQIVNMLF